MSGGYTKYEHIKEDENEKVVTDRNGFNFWMRYPKAVAGGILRGWQMLVFRFRGEAGQRG